MAKFSKICHIVLIIILMKYNIYILVPSVSTITKYCVLLIYKLSEAADPYRSWSPLTEEGYAEKLRLLREAASIPMERWRAPTVLAWLEIALGMPQYGPRCAENVKSGKV